MYPQMTNRSAATEVNGCFKKMVNYGSGEGPPREVDATKKQQESCLMPGGPCSGPSGPSPGSAPSTGSPAPSSWSAPGFITRRPPTVSAQHTTCPSMRLWADAMMSLESGLTSGGGSCGGSWGPHQQEMHNNLHTPIQLLVCSTHITTTTNSKLSGLDEETDDS